MERFTAFRDKERILHEGVIRGGLWAFGQAHETFHFSCFQFADEPCSADIPPYA